MTYITRSGRVLTIAAREGMARTMRLLALLAVITLIPSTGAAPINSVVALAPVEILADGFGDLRGIVIDGHGDVYVADRVAGTVTKIDRDQARTTVVSGLRRPVGVA